MGTITLFTLLAAAFISTASQTSADPYFNDTFNFKHLLTIDQDFVGPGRIISIAQDSKGFIWFGGETGLARYDGNRFKMFYHQAIDAHSLSSNFIRALKVDSNGVMWVVSAATHGGLMRYDERHQNFIRYENSSPVSIDAIDSDSEGNVYLVTNSGYAVLAVGDSDFKPLIIPSDDATQSVEIKGTSLFVDRTDRLWLSNSDAGVVVYDKKYKMLRSWHLANRNDVTASDIKSMFQDRLGQIWISTNGSGVVRISADLNILKTFQHDPNDQHSLGSDMTSSIVEDKNGKIWIVTVNSGLSIFDPETELFTRHISHGEDPASIKTNATQLIFRDRADDLWLAQYPVGVDYLDMDGHEVIRKLNNPEDASSISHNGILAIKPDYKGDIWIGTEEGLNYFNKKAGTFTRYLKESTSGAKTSGLTSNTILSLEEDIDHTFWIGTYGGGLHKFDPQTKLFTHLPSDAAGGYTGNIIWALFRDSTDTIWVAGSEGLARYNRMSNNFTYFPELSVGTPFKDKMILIEPRLGKILVGSFWGLHLLDVKTGESSRIGENNSSFVDQNINSLAKLDNGETWIATENGIVFMGRDDQIVGRLGVEQGMPAKQVSTVKQLSDGQVWANTGNGVAIINPTTKQITTLYKSHGLACDGYKHGVLIHEDADNNIYLGGTDGLSILPRQNNKYFKHPLTVSIIGLSILNSDALPDVDGSPLTQPISETQSIELNHHQNMFALEFSALDYKLSDRIEYEYILEGFNSGWINPGPNLVAAFTNLNPGRYRFLVRAHERGSTASDNYTVLNINVRPAPWRSSLAIFGYFLFISVGFYGFLSIRELQQKKLAAEKSAQTKSEFFATISHEIRTPLAGVIGMLALAIKDKTLSQKSAEKLRIAKANADILLNVTSDILDLNKMEAGKLQSEAVSFDLRSVLLKELESIASVAQQKNLTLLLILPRDIPLCTGDPTRLAQVLRKLLHNAIKFTESGEVKVKVEFANDRNRQEDWVTLKFSIHDTGIGIAPDNIRKLFSKFAQAETTSARSYYGGTGLGLAICKKLVMLMNGEISAKSELGKGSTFQFSIPLMFDRSIPVGDGAEFRTIEGGSVEIIEITKSTARGNTPPILTETPLQQKLRAAFKSSLSRRIQEIESAREQKDYETLGRVFHGIKGSAAQLGDQTLAEVCSDLEKSADASDFSYIDAHYEKFVATTAPYLTDSLL